MITPAQGISPAQATPVITPAAVPQGFTISAITPNTATQVLPVTPFIQTFTPVTPVSPVTQTFTPVTQTIHPTLTLVTPVSPVTIHSLPTSLPTTPFAGAAPQGFTPVITPAQATPVITPAAAPQGFTISPITQNTITPVSPFTTAPVSQHTFTPVTPVSPMTPVSPVTQTFTPVTPAWPVAPQTTHIPLPQATFTLAWPVTIHPTLTVPTASFSSARATPVVPQAATQSVITPLGSALTITP
jgi:serine/threonine protein kinase